MFVISSELKNKDLIVKNADENIEDGLLYEVRSIEIIQEVRKVYDFMREPFGQLMDLGPHCDTIEKLTANCPRCSEKGTAIFTARRRGNGSDKVYIGGKEIYEPMCRRHYIQYYYA